MRKSAPLFCALLLSLSARRAWIEIPAGCWRDARRAVALRKESVDRNNRRFRAVQNTQIVALRKESVDRNLKRSKVMKNRRVALRKESVDRNSSPNTDIIILDGRSPQGERG